jgi:hypothetical protein
MNNLLRNCSRRGAVGGSEARTRLCPRGGGAVDQEARGVSRRARLDALEPEEVAGVLIEGPRAGLFPILPQPEILELLRRNAADYGRWLAGMRGLQARVQAGGWVR